MEDPKIRSINPRQAQRLRHQFHLNQNRGRISTSQLLLVLSTPISRLYRTRIGRLTKSHRSRQSSMYRGLPLLRFSASQHDLFLTPIRKKTGCSNKSRDFHHSIHRHRPKQKGLSLMDSRHQMIVRIIIYKTLP